MNDNEQKYILNQFLVEENYPAIEEMLRHIPANFDINYPDQNGCSPLFLALSLGYLKKRPEVIRQLISRGAVIKNGRILKPEHFPKLITRYANARNLQYIFKKYFEFGRAFRAEDLILEIGSGNGYLKYLLGLCNDRTMDSIKNRLIETEPSEDLILDTADKGKTIIQAGIEELENYFSNGEFPLVVSMNVLDILDDRELKRDMKILYRILQKNGIMIHIMSSSVHKNVFRNIKSLYQKYMMLPYYKDGYVGVRLAAFKNSGSLGFSNSNQGPEELAELFARRPDKYIELADRISGVFKDIEDSCILILLRDFSIWKMTRALTHAGFSVLRCEEVSSNTVVDANRYHAHLPGYNSFTNIVGSLITDINDTIDEGKVDEKSVFIYLMAQKM